MPPSFRKRKQRKLSMRHQQIQQSLRRKKKPGKPRKKSRWQWSKKSHWPPRKFQLTTKIMPTKSPPKLPTEREFLLSMSKIKHSAITSTRWEMFQSKDSEALLNVDGNELIKDPEEANALTRQYIFGITPITTANHHTCRSGIYPLFGYRIPPEDIECLSCWEIAVNQRKLGCFSAAKNEEDWGWKQQLLTYFNKILTILKRDIKRSGPHPTLRLDIITFNLSTQSVHLSRPLHHTGPTMDTG